MHTRLQPGLLKVRFETEDELLPTAQGRLMGWVRASAAEQPTALVVDLGHLTRFSPATPNAWLEVVTEVSPRITAVAIVTRSLVARCLTGAFSLACTFRRVPLAVEVFDDAKEAEMWALAHLPSTHPLAVPPLRFESSGSRWE